MINTYMFKYWKASFKNFNKLFVGKSSTSSSSWSTWQTVRTKLVNFNSRIVKINDPRTSLASSPSFWRILRNLPKHSENQKWAIARQEKLASLNEWLSDWLNNWLPTGDSREVIYALWGVAGTRLCRLYIYLPADKGDEWMEAWLR